MNLTFQQAVNKLQSLIDTYGLKAVRWHVAVFNADSIFDGFSRKDLASSLLDGIPAVSQTAKEMLEIDLAYDSERWEDEPEVAEAVGGLLTEWSDLLSSKGV